MSAPPIESSDPPLLQLFSGGMLLDERIEELFQNFREAMLAHGVDNPEREILPRYEYGLIGKGGTLFSEENSKIRISTDSYSLVGILDYQGEQREIAMAFFVANFSYYFNWLLKTKQWNYASTLENIVSVFELKRPQTFVKGGMSVSIICKDNWTNIAYALTLGNVESAILRNGHFAFRSLKVASTSPPKVTFQTVQPEDILVIGDPHSWPNLLKYGPDIIKNPETALQNAYEECCTYTSPTKLQQCVIQTLYTLLYQLHRTKEIEFLERQVQVPCKADLLSNSLKKVDLSVFVGKLLYITSAIKENKQINWRASIQLIQRTSKDGFSIAKLNLGKNPLLSKLVYQTLIGMQERDISQPEQYILPRYEKPLQTSFNGIEFMGKKRLYQDRCCVQTLNERFFLCGVYDGHCNMGELVAIEIKHTLSLSLLRKIEKMSGDIEQAFIDIFHKLNEKICSKYPTGGSTAYVALIDKIDNILYSSIIGDSEGKIYRKQNEKGTLFPLSPERNFDHPEEYVRAILANPAYKEAFELTSGKKRKRVGQIGSNGKAEGLNLSRTIGDRDFKVEKNSGIIISTPLVTAMTLQPNDLLITATDGLWDFVTDKEVIDVIEHPEIIVQKAHQFFINKETFTPDDIRMLKAMFAFIHSSLSSQEFEKIRRPICEVSPDFMFKLISPDKFSKHSSTLLSFLAYMNGGTDDITIFVVNIRPL